MNTQSNAMNGTTVEAQAIAPATLSQTRPFYWSLRREFWENRWIFLAPLSAAGVFLFGFLISAIQIPAKMRALSGLDPMQQRDAIAQPYDMAAGFLMAIAIFVGAFYCLNALQAERRDRSILFWKSMPVSDATVVLSKAVVPILILQLFTFAVTFVLQFLMLLINSAVLAGSGQSVAMLWTQLSPFQMWLMLFYHLVTVHSLWHAPFYSWMLLVSSWARRAAFLWAALPFVAIVALEKLLFRSTHFANVLGYQLSGESTVVFVRDFPTNPMSQLTPIHFLLSPGLWGGLLFTAICLAGAVRLRRYRSPL